MPQGLKAKELHTLTERERGRGGRGERVEGGELTEVGQQWAVMHGGAEGDAQGTFTI